MTASLLMYKRRRNAEENQLWFGREQDGNGARQTSWLPNDSILGYSDYYVQSRYTHTMCYVADLLKKRGLGAKRLGVEMDGYWFNARMYLTLQKELPEVTLLDGTNLVNWVKTVKSAAEIDYMR